MRLALFDPDYGWRCPSCKAGLNPNETLKHVSPCWSCGKESRPTDAYIEAERRRKGRL